MNKPDGVALIRPTVAIKRRPDKAQQRRHPAYY